MRKGFAIFLLVVSLYPFMGTKAILLLRKQAVREAVKERILAGVGQNELVELTFSLQATKADLKWEHSKEFEYKGEMYDVVKSEQRADSITYWCIHDKAETEINRQLDKLTAHASGKDPQHKAALGNFFDFLKSLFCNEQPTVERPAIASVVNHFTYQFSTKTLYPPADSPPPERAVFSA
ncbi:MAG: hypothetical protein IPN76_19605 [Saprospiraceae bacterium]|nr:hypothetical protein [Saprospiraceae bacterium]